MRSVRDQSRRSYVDLRVNMMRLWESLKWSLGKRKGLKRELSSEFQDAEEVRTGETGEGLETEDHGVGGFHGDSAELPYGSV